MSCSDKDKDMTGDDYNQFINRLNGSGTRKLNVNGDDV